MDDPVEVTVSRHQLPGSRYDYLEEICRRDGQPMRDEESQPLGPINFYESVKLDRLVRPRSYLEAAGVHHAEVASGVIKYDLHPAKFRWGRDRMLTPVRREWLADGSILMVAFREDGYPERNSFNAKLLEEAEEVFSSLGYFFMVETRASLLAEPRYSAIREIQAHRKAEITPAQDSVAYEVLERGCISFHDFIHYLPPPNPRAAAFAMMVRRILTIDIQRGLTPFSLVSSVKDQS